MRDAKPNFHVGTQGWNYDAWVGPFFPVSTRPAEFLSVYSRAFASVEVDSTFYGVPALATFQSWYDRTPANFVFSLKLPQEITHEQRLRDTLGIGETFYERARALKHKLGPILVQLGPDFDPGELPALVDCIGRFLPTSGHREFRHRGWIPKGSAFARRTRITLVAGHDSRRHDARAARNPTADLGTSLDGAESRPRRLLAGSGGSHARDRCLDGSDRRDAFNGQRCLRICG